MTDPNGAAKNMGCYMDPMKIYPRKTIGTWENLRKTIGKWRFTLW
jgi:hypothetical protein